jgi:Flp pilus assembly protein CpaB
VTPVNYTFLPNSRVDVVCTVQAGAAAADSRVIVQNLPLLGVRGSGAPGEKEQVATLGVTAEEAQQLRDGAALGSLRLVLR